MASQPTCPSGYVMRASGLSSRSSARPAGGSKGQPAARPVGSVTGAAASAGSPGAKFCAVSGRVEGSCCMVSSWVSDVGE